MPNRSIWDEIDQELNGTAPARPRSVWDEIDAELQATPPVAPPVERPPLAPIAPVPTHARAPIRPVPAHVPDQTAAIDTFVRTPVAAPTPPAAPLSAEIPAQEPRTLAPMRPVPAHGVPPAGPMAENEGSFAPLVDVQRTLDRVHPEQALPPDRPDPNYLQPPTSNAPVRPHGPGEQAAQVAGEFIKTTFGGLVAANAEGLTATGHMLGLADDEDLARVQQTARSFAPSVHTSVLDDPAGTLGNPMWWAGAGGQVTGSVLSLMGAGGIGMAGGSRAAQFLHLTGKARAAVTAAGGVAAAGIAESWLEGSLAYSEAIERGATPEQAGIAAAKVFAVNLPLTMASGIPLFNPQTKRAIVNALVNVVAEGGQEASQEVTGNWAAQGYDPNQSLTEGVADAAFIGGVVGPIAGAGIQRGAQMLPQGGEVSIDTDPSQPVSTRVDPAQPGSVWDEIDLALQQEGAPAQDPTAPASSGELPARDALASPDAPGAPPAESPDLEAVPLSADDARADLLEWFATAGVDDTYTSPTVNAQVVERDGRRLLINSKTGTEIDTTTREGAEVSPSTEASAGSPGIATSEEPPLPGAPKPAWHPESRYSLDEGDDSNDAEAVVQLVREEQAARRQAIGALEAAIADPANAKKTRQLATWKQDLARTRGEYQGVYDELEHNILHVDVAKLRDEIEHPPQIPVTPKASDPAELTPPNDDKPDLDTPLAQPQQQTAQQERAEALAAAAPFNYDLETWKAEQREMGFTADEVNEAVSQSAAAGIDPTKSDDLNDLDTFVTAVEEDEDFRAEQVTLGHVDNQELMAWAREQQAKPRKLADLTVEELDALSPEEMAERLIAEEEEETQEATVADVLAPITAIGKAADERAGVFSEEFEEPESHAPIVFRSGNQKAPADLAGYIKAGQAVGITADASYPVYARAAQYAARGGQVFVDSGAFQERTTGVAPNFDKILEFYEKFADRLDVDADGLLGNLYVVAPDKVGDADATRARQDLYADRITKLIERGVHVIVPVQMGNIAYDAGQVAKQWPGAIIGVPANKDAATVEDLDAIAREITRAHGRSPGGVHFLGMGEKNAKFPAFVKAIRTHFPDVAITADSNRTAAMMVAGRPAHTAAKANAELEAAHIADDVDAEQDNEEEWERTKAQALGSTVITQEGRTKAIAEHDAKIPVTPKAHAFVARDGDGKTRTFTDSFHASVWNALHSVQGSTTRIARARTLGRADFAKFVREEFGQHGSGHDGYSYETKANGSMVVTGPTGRVTYSLVTVAQTARELLERHRPLPVQADKATPELTPPDIDAIQAKGPLTPAEEKRLRQLRAMDAAGQEMDEDLTDEMEALELRVPTEPGVEDLPDHRNAASEEDWPRMDPADIFPAPDRVVSLPLFHTSAGIGKNMREAGGQLLTPAQAAAKLAEWKAEAARIGRDEDHSREVVISLFDRTGIWSQPYADAGYTVIRYDRAHGDDILEHFPIADIQELKDKGYTIVGVLAGPPCTSFTVSGARWWENQHDKADQQMVEKKYGYQASKYFDTPLDYANTLVRAVEVILELAAPTQFHAMENPVGRIAEQNELPKPTLSFDPAHFGDPYTKRTLLWGTFNPDLPMAPVEPTKGSFIHTLRGDDPAQKAQRSVTPEGFAYAFFMANHAPPAEAQPQIPVTAKKAEQNGWTKADAESFVADLEADFEAWGFTPEIVGSVQTKGRSGHDLDIALRYAGDESIQEQMTVFLEQLLPAITDKPHEGPFDAPDDDWFIGVELKDGRYAEFYFSGENDPDFEMPEHRPSKPKAEKAAQPQIPVTPPKAKPEPTAQVTHNQAQGGIEITFPGKPDAAVIARLKGAGFRWSARQKLWYAKVSKLGRNIEAAMAQGRHLAGLEPDPDWQRPAKPQIPVTPPKVEKKPYDGPRYKPGDKVEFRDYDEKWYETEVTSDTQDDGRTGIWHPNLRMQGFIPGAGPKGQGVAIGGASRTQVSAEADRIRPVQAKAEGPQIPITPQPGQAPRAEHIVRKLHKGERSQWTEIGKNANGDTLYEDQRGVRSIVYTGVRHTEPVAISPLGTYAVDRTSEQRAKEWNVAEPAATIPVKPKAPKRLSEFRELFRKTSEEKVGGGPKTTAADRMTWVGELAGQDVEIRTMPRPIVEGESFLTNAGMRLRDNKLGQGGYFLDVEILAGDTPEVRAALQPLLEAIDERPIRIRAKGEKFRTGVVGASVDLSPVTAQAVRAVIAPILAEHPGKFEEWPKAEAALRSGFGTHPTSGVIFYDVRGLELGAVQIRRAGGDWQQNLRLAVDEELTHARDLKASKTDLAAAENSAIYATVPAAVDEALRALYRHPDPEPWRMLFELVRMKDQLRRLNLVTEIARGDDDTYAKAIAVIAGWTPTGKIAARLAAIGEDAKPALSPERQAIADKQAANKAKRDAAVQRIKDKLKTQINAGIDPDILKDMVEIGRLYIDDKILSFKDATLKFREEYGEDFLRQVTPYWERMWAAYLKQPGKVADVLREAQNTPEGAHVDDSSLTTAGSDGAGSGESAQPGGTTPDPVRAGDEGALDAVPPADSGQPGPGRPGQGDSGSVESGGVRDDAPPASAPGAAPGSGAGTVSTHSVSPSGVGHDPGVAPPDYQLTPERIAGIIGRGDVQRFKDNVRAIAILRDLQQEQRHATADEQEALAKYVGWGASELQYYLEESPQRGWSGPVKTTWENLRDLTTPEQRADMRRSRPNAHYTFDLYRPIWSALEWFGFSGGRVLEPAIGSGHAIGFMPAQIRAGSTIAASELDPITAGIAQHLYPSIKVQATGYEAIRLPRGTQDLVISNVPFGDFGVSDKLFSGARKFLTERIHNYFFAKALEHVRPGGYIVFLTSRYTMDGTEHTRARRYLMEHAHFVGAVRLPGGDKGAFTKSAKTEVVSDLIVLQKRLPDETESRNAELFINTVDRADLSSTRVGRKGKLEVQHVYTSSWFGQHPQFLLGTESKEGTMYGGNEYTLTAAADANIPELLEQALKVILPAGAYQSASDLAAHTPTRFADGAYKPGELRAGEQKHTIEMVQADGTIVDATPRKKDGTVNTKEVTRLLGLIGVRDARRAVVAAMKSSTSTKREIEAAQGKLKKAYNAFHKEHGRLNDRANKAAFKHDPEAATLLALEVITTQATVVKQKDGTEKLVLRNEVTGLADIFEKRTINAPPAIEHVSTPYDALVTSMGVKTRIDWSYMASLYAPRTKPAGPVPTTPAPRTDPRNTHEYVKPSLPGLYTDQGVTHRSGHTGVVTEYFDQKGGGISIYRVQWDNGETTLIEASQVTLGENRARVKPEVLPSRVKELQDKLLEQGHVFRQPDGAWITKDEYLSGDVVTKLADAQAALEQTGDQVFQRSIDALTAIQPVPKEPHEIEFAFGAHWNDPADMRAFAHEQLGYDAGAFSLTATEAYVRWNVNWGSFANSSADNTHDLAVRYGPNDRLVYSFTDMVDDALNLKMPSLGWTEGTGDDKRYIKAPKATMAARANIEVLKARFTQWVIEHPEVAGRMADTYNTRFNRTVKRTFNGDHLANYVDAKGKPTKPTEGGTRSAALPGLELPFLLHPHQLRAVWRILTTGNTLLAHEVGAGKTFEMIVAAMEMRRTGRARKPMITVPTNLLGQWREDILRAYPTAKLLAFEEKDLEGPKRQEAMARIAHGDWDIVLVPHSSFQLLKVSPARMVSTMREWITEIEDAIQEARAREGKDSLKGKELDKAKRRIEDKVQRVLDRANRGTDNAMTWEQLGVDALMVDEAQAFKNLYFFTKMDNIRGLSRSESDRALEMFIKVKDINEASNYRNLVFATATPIMNSLAEVYTMQRYLQPQRLRQHGFNSFDNWYATFAGAKVMVEKRPDGSYQEVLRVAKFRNMKVLSAMVSEVMDYVGWEDMPYLALPKIKGGKITVIDGEQHPMYPTLKAWFTERLQAIKDMPPHVDQHTGEYIAPERIHPITQQPMHRKDNILTIMNDAKLAAIDARLVLPGHATDFKGSRLQAVAAKVADFYKREHKKKGVTLIFLDVGVPRGPSPLEFLRGIQTEDQTGGDATGLEDDGVDADADALPDDEDGAFNLYDATKAALIKKGIKSEEIAYIHQTTNAAERLALFQAAREGKVRVVFASTDKGGVGMNIQHRLGLLIEMDVPKLMRPGDSRQRLGRVIRQGNTYDEVEVVRFITKDSTDEWLYGLMSEKQTKITQFMRGDLDSYDEQDVAGMDYDEAQMRASGNPLGIELIELRASIGRLEAQAAAGTSQAVKAAGWKADAEKQIPHWTKVRDTARAWLDAHWRTIAGDAFEITIDGQTITERKKANTAIQAAMRRAATALDPLQIGEVRGLPLMAEARRTWDGPEVRLYLDGDALGEGDIAITTAALIAEGQVQDNFGEGRNFVGSLADKYNALPELAAAAERRIDNATTDLAKAEEILKRPNTAADKARTARARITELEDLFKAQADAQERDAAATRQERAAELQRRMQAPSGNASAGMFNQVHAPKGAKNPAGGPRVNRLEFPELVQLARELIGDPRVVAKFRGIREKRGDFRPYHGIRLHAGLFRFGQEFQLAATMAHEIGHLLDWLPDRSLKRGNILGRLQTLRDFLKHTYTDANGNDIKLAEVRKELLALSELWRPYDATKVAASFITYRRSSKELYADAVSVLLNDPWLLEKEAPIFYKQFFEQLDQKPAAKQAYFGLLSLMGGTREDVVERRRESVRTMFESGSDTALRQQARVMEERREARRNLWFRFRMHLIDRDHPIRRLVKARVKAGATIPAEVDPRYFLEERRHLASHVKGWVEKYVQPIQTGLTAADVDWSTFGEVLFYERILAGDRSEIANPNGIQEDAAREMYDALIDQLGPAKTQAVKDAAVAFRQVMRDVADHAYRAGLYTDALHQQMRDNPAYVTFQVIEHMDNGASSRIFKQIGTTKWINHPADATILKAMVTIRATVHNTAKRMTFDFMEQHAAGDIAQAPETKDKQRRPLEPEPKDRDKWTLVTYMDNGRLRGKHVDHYVAASLEQEEIGHTFAVVSVLRTLHSGFFRPVFTTLNLGFQIANMKRDMDRAYKNTREYRSYVMHLARTLNVFSKPMALARVRAFGLPANPSAKQIQAYKDLLDAEHAKILTATLNSRHADRVVEDTQFEDILARSGVGNFKPIPWMAPAWTGAAGSAVEWTREQIVDKLLDPIEKLGNLIETLPKAIALYHYKGDKPIAEIPANIRSHIRRNVGSPDFKIGGTYKPVYNELLLFSNAIKEGVRADVGMAIDPTTASGWWWKTVKLNVVPKLIMAAALAGLFGDDDDEEDEPSLQKLMSRVTEYDFTNYLVLPLGDDHGNTVYLRIPQDDTGRLIGGIVWKAFSTAAGRSDVMTTLAHLADYTAGQFPGVSPVLKSGAAAVQYAGGQNPYDSFRNRFVLTEDEHKARDWAALKKFLGWEFQTLGGGIVWRFNAGGYRPEQRTRGQAFLELPVISNVVGRFVRITNYGESDALRRTQDSQAQQEARARRAVRDEVTTAVQAFLDGGKANPGQLVAAARRIAQEHKPGDPEAFARVLRQMRMAQAKAGSDVLTEAVIGAGSNAQKVGLIREAKPSKEWLEAARKAGVISDDLLLMLRRTGTIPVTPRVGATR